MSAVYIRKTTEIDDFLKKYIVYYTSKHLQTHSQIDEVKNRKQDPIKEKTPVDEMLNSDTINLDKLLELVSEYSKWKGDTVITVNDLLKNTTIMNRIELPRPENVDDNKIFEEQRYQRLISKFKPKANEKVLPPLGIGLNAIMTVVMTFIGAFYLAVNHAKMGLVMSVSVALVVSFIAITVECILFIMKF
ncbi:conserved Plasmodium protein, unknown function [Babesia microti strain RI]|uniref:Uncharacterized protein n=1 Tax=Babesia microti (strain RI) TaxID=1133968 RepID=A0A1N6LWW0_BABMR|nr:conserved Plasmodium protein, unknown function [Babesia microti strain RI]SIO73356.1 conserved Plasmodium protein, unknown function [Babesia microti strain RI]|eukprot:XP_021337458.1 conserved Plasmodium protein, unknown function [Babesia microti strain RI]